MEQHTSKPRAPWWLAMTLGGAALGAAVTLAQHRMRRSAGTVQHLMKMAEHSAGQLDARVRAVSQSMREN